MFCHLQLFSQEAVVRGNLNGQSDHWSSGYFISLAWKARVFPGAASEGHATTIEFSQSSDALQPLVARSAVSWHITKSQVW